MPRNEARRFDAPRGWSDEQNEFLKTEWIQSRLTNERIARHIGKGEDACKKQARKLGLPTRRRNDEWSPELLETVKALWLEGLSATQVGQRTGLTRNAILGKLHRQNVYRPRREVSEETKRQRRRDAEARWRAKFRVGPPRLKRFNPLPIPNFTVPESEWVPYLENTGCRAILDDKDKRCCGREIKYRSYCIGHAGAYYLARR